jgi:hypothetical protein
MRFDLRLHGKTDTGQLCVADVSVYADSSESLIQQAHEAGASGPWYAADKIGAPIPDNSTITVERVELLNKDKKRPTR